MISCVGCGNLISDTLARCPVCGAAGASAAARARSAATSERVALRGVERGVTVLFALFALQLVAAGAACAVGEGPAAADWRAGLLAGISVAWLAALAAAWGGWLPRWVFLVGLLGPAALGVVYLGACHREIARLGGVRRAAAWVGCLGPAAVLLSFAPAG